MKTVASTYGFCPVLCCAFFFFETSVAFTGLFKKNPLSIKMAATTESSNDGSAIAGMVDLSSYLRSMEDQLGSELCEVVSCVANACENISMELARQPLNSLRLEENDGSDDVRTNVQGEKQAKMDVLSNHIFKSHLEGEVAAMASEEEADVIPGLRKDKQYSIAFDPLDGSSNLDTSIPTGTIFSISPHTPDTPFSSSGRSIVAAGYALYSSSTHFVLSLGPSGSLGAVCFTLDPRRQRGSLLDSDIDAQSSSSFVLTRSPIVCPIHGPYYSLNDAREPDWPDGLRAWIHDAKRGSTPSGTTFSARYVCSLVADVHRTLLKGGWAGNPRPHLRLLYEAAPLAHVAEACGGKGSDGVRNLLDVLPRSLHDRVCVFVGSVGDVNELEEYGDVQQTPRRYDA